MEKEIKIGQKYRHFKGHIIEITGMAKHSETLEDLIVYKHLGTNEFWARPKKMFFEDDDVSNRKDNITGQTHRFEPYIEN